MRKDKLFDKIFIANHGKYTLAQYGNISSPSVSTMLLPFLSCYDLDNDKLMIFILYVTFLCI